MKKFAVIGHPISHSHSPALHHAGFQEFEIEAEFDPIDVAPEDLKKWLDTEFRKNYTGVAVTAPHKIAIRKFVDEETEAAKQIGAVNTITNQDGKIIGNNTDAIGALRAIITVMPDLSGKNALVLGAGGAARAIIFALRKSGVRVTIWNRTAETAIDLAKEFGAETAEDLKFLDPEKFDLVVNATTVGLRKWESILPESFWLPKHTAFDTVYDPLETKFIADAEQAGAQTITGDKMLVHQALEQFHLWHGIAPEPEIFERAFFE